MNNILSLLPQQPPFVMVDALLHADENNTRTEFTVREDNVLTMDGHFTEGGLLENMAQTAAAGAGYRAREQNEPVRNGYIGAVKNMEVFFLPRINDKLVTEIQMEETVFDMNVVSGKVYCNNQLSAQCELKIFLR